MNKSRVFIVQDMGFSYEDAEEHFGELIYLLSRKEGNVFNMRRTAAIMKKRLWDYGFTEHDYILAVGAPALIILAGILAQSLTPVLHVLQWDRVDKKYYKITYKRS